MVLVFGAQVLVLVLVLKVKSLTKFLKFVFKHDQDHDFVARTRTRTFAEKPLMDGFTRNFAQGVASRTSSPVSNFVSIG